MKIVFALALGLAIALPLAAPPVFAQSRSTSSARAVRRQKIARLFPQLSLRPNALATHIGSPRQSASRSTSAIIPRATARLNFGFVGFPDTQARELKGFVDSNYSLITQVWGEPAPEQRGKTVVVNNVAGASTYFPPASTSSTGGEIDFDFINSGIPAENQFRLLKLVLNAFQGPRVPAFNFNEGQYVEPYLLGASEAAALQILYRAQGSPASFDPRLYADYVLPFYDAFNSPALGNPFIYSPDRVDVTVGDFRMAMSQAAFLKLYTEKATFFSEFNAALYARGAARTSISTDQLETLAAGVVPQVEGLPFRAWVREQGALNARVQTGNKMYLVALPSRANATGDTRSAAAIFAEAFATDTKGNDVPLFAGAPGRNGVALPAYGTLDAFDETGRNINSFSNELRGSSVLSFDDTSAPGEATKAAGFAPFGSPLAARVTFRARLGATEGTAIFPFGAAGTTSSPSTIFGATLGGTSGTIAVSSNGQTQNVPIARGTFASTLVAGSGPRVQTTLSDGTKTFKRNTAWLAPPTATSNVRSLEFLLPGAGAAVSSSTLSLNTANGNLKMIAFPLRPLERDEARALNIAPTSLLLARFRPELSPATLSGGALQFGIGGSKYELYPNISEGPEAGRGYWLQIPANGLTTPVAGTFAPTNTSVEVELKGGWNQIGVPRAASVNTFGVKVRFGGYSPVSLQEAQARGWIAPGVWRYNGRNGYERVDVAGGTLVPWEGYWMFASPQAGISLVFEPATSAQPPTSAQAVRALSSTTSWTVGIAAASSSSRDTSASFGVSSAIPAAKPPVASRQLSVYFPATDAASGSGSGSAQGFLKKLGVRNEWRFTVDGAVKGERVTLFWPRFGAPASVQLQGRDDATGRVFSIKAGGKWAFTSDGTPRQFSIFGTTIRATADSIKGS